MAGPAVKLKDASATGGSFIAPGMAQRSDLAFRLTTMDDQSLLNAATVTVAVDPAQLSFHPSEDVPQLGFSEGDSSWNWPATQGNPAGRRRPRRAPVVITKDDEGVAGL